MIYIVILAVIACGVMLVLLVRKKSLDRSALDELQAEIVKENYKLKVIDAKIIERQKIIDALTAEEQRQKENIDNHLKFYEQTRRNELQKLWDTKANEQSAALEDLEEKTQAAIEEAEWQQKQLQRQLDSKKDEYNSLIEPFQNIEKERQARLFYTIQIPEEYKEDIDYLLTTVAEKVNHPDIIAKLIWQEYMKPYLEDTFKRLNIKNEPGIYKLTSLIDNKCYIGKSTDVKKRIQDHFKSVAGIKSIADQAVHHAIQKEGFWNWTIEIITYCDKEALGEKEKIYIDTFQGQTWGYNKREGG